MSVGQLQDWMERTFECECGKQHHIPIKKIVIDKKALQQVAVYIKERGYKRPVMIVDERTNAVAGQRLLKIFTEEKLRLHEVHLIDHPTGDVVADETTIIDAMLQIPNDSDVIIAVGAGTIHDIARFIASKMNVPFISVPTAPSVDGFSSVGAPLVIRRFKQTIHCGSPEAIFADLDILAESPQAMVAAGFGDMLGKYTSIADWELGRLLLDEEYCPLAVKMTLHGLQLCIDGIDDIAQQTEHGVKVLMEGLLWSGISMLIYGSSRPASGSEHHLSHFWEMNFLLNDKKAVLHGTKVGVATVLIAEQYERLANRVLTEEEQSILRAASKPDVTNDIENIKQAYGAIADEVIAENFPANGQSLLEIPLANKICDHWDEIQSICRQVPSKEQMVQWLQSVQGAVEPTEIGVSPELANDALKSSFYIRNRFTIIRLLKYLP